MAKKYENQYFYELEKPGKNLSVRQYIYHIGPYRYNWHKHVEVMLVMSGAVELSVAGQIYQLEEDDIVVINSMVGHASLSKKSGTIAMVLHVDPVIFAEYYDDTNLVFMCRSDESNRHEQAFCKMRGILATMMGRATGRQPMDQMRYESQLYRLIALVLSSFPPSAMKSYDLERYKKQLSMIDQLLGYIEGNYRDKITLEDLAERTGYNANYVSQFFKRTIGINFYDYLTRIRLREATLDLTVTDGQVLDIALKHGFPDLKSFNTQFKKNFHKSPLEYRAALDPESRRINIQEKRNFVACTSDLANRKLELYQREMEQGKILHDMEASVMLQMDMLDSTRQAIVEAQKHLTQLQGDLYVMAKKEEQLRKEIGMGKIRV